MRGLFQCGSRDALAHLLVPHSRLSIRAELLALTDFKTVHHRFQSNKLSNRIAFSLVSKKSNFASVWVVMSSQAAWVICWDFAEIKQATQLRHVKKIFVEIIRKELHYQRFGVCVGHSHSGAVPVFQSSLSALHVKLAIIEHGEPELERFVYDLIEFSTLYCNQVVI